jgi:hypothetical protein
MNRVTDVTVRVTIYFARLLALEPLVALPFSSMPEDLATFQFAGAWELWENRPRQDVHGLRY